MSSKTHLAWAASALAVLSASACGSEPSSSAGGAGSPAGAAGSGVAGFGVAGSGGGASGSAGGGNLGGAGLNASGGAGAGSGGGGAAGAPGSGGGLSGAGQGGTSAGSGGASSGSGGGGGATAGTGPTLGTLDCGKTWSNPAKGDTWAHDPSLTREGNVYFLFSTPAPVMAPAIRELVSFKSSTDGATWTHRGSVFPSPLDWWNDDIAMPETWAAEVRKVNGTYYLYYSISAWNNFSSSIGLATNTTLDPTSPSYAWVDRGKVIDFRNGGTGVNVIDPNLFVESDGSFWLVYGSYKAGLRLVQLNPATGKLLNDPPELTVLTNSLGEGSGILKRGSYYYLTVSTGSCCVGLASTYHVGVGRSSTLKGPYMTKDNRSMLSGAYTTLLRGDANHPGLGGQSFYEENGRIYMVYHAYTAPSGEPRINVRPVFFDAEGWPTMDPCLASR